MSGPARGEADARPADLAAGILPLAFFGGLSYAAWKPKWEPHSRWAHRHEITLASTACTGCRCPVRTIPWPIKSHLGPRLRCIS